MSINDGLLLAGALLLLGIASSKFSARLRDLALPDGVVVSLIVRGREGLMPCGTT